MSRRRGLAGLALALMLHAGAHAQDAAIPAASAASALHSELDDCSTIEKDAPRLKCYEKVAGRKPKENPPGELGGFKGWQVRDSGSIAPEGDQDLGKKAALLQAGRTDGANFTTASVGVFAIFSANHPDAPAWNGWQPFLGATWDRDTSAKTPKDLKQVVAGITDSIHFGPMDRANALLPTFRIGYKDESKAQETAGFVNAHVELVLDVLTRYAEGKDKNTPLLVPYFGLYAQTSHTKPAADTDGSALSGYVGAHAGYKLNAILEGLSATAQGQWYHDISAPGKSVRHRFASAGLQYDLVDPDTKKGWVPSISLTWQHGTEPVTGEGPGQKAVLGFGAKFN